MSDTVPEPNAFVPHLCNCHLPYIKLCYIVIIMLKDLVNYVGLCKMFIGILKHL